MDIKGITNTTLNDYPGLVAATIYTGSCDFSCPFCFNRSLVIKPEKLPSMNEEEVLEFLQQRRVALEGVCITGGEPLMQPDLMSFLYKLRMLGYKIKLDTNGYDPVHLTHILEQGLVDYVAMDIKNSQLNYARTIGRSDFDLTRIKLSVDIIKESGVDYEYKTTVVRELHTPQDIEDIGRWLAGVKAYYLQPYIDGDDVIMPVFSSYSKTQMKDFLRVVKNYIPKAELRGYEA